MQFVMAAPAPDILGFIYDQYQHSPTVWGIVITFQHLLQLALQALGLVPLLLKMNVLSRIAKLGNQLHVISASLWVPDYDQSSWRSNSF